MDECFKCGISGDKTLLIDAISNEGIVKICRKCSLNEDIPLIRKPTLVQLREPEKRQTVYERLSKVAGIKDNVPKNKELKKQETTLREIIDKRFEVSVKEEKTYDDLIDNFHWVLMRMRRLRKVTPEQLAEKIDESPQSIKMAEKGVLGKNYFELIKKLEDYFGIRLIKKEFAPKEKKSIEVVDSELLGKPEMVFDNRVSKDLTISDLKNMKDKHEIGIFEKEEYVFNEDMKGDEGAQEFVKKEESTDKQDSNLESSSEDDLTQEEIDTILFGAKKN